MKDRRQINGMTLLRPLLGIRRRELREFLADRGQDWREDASNQSKIRPEPGAAISGIPA